MVQILLVMKRKITKMGPSSLVISLPSRWVKANSLSKGDDIEVTEDGKKLVVSLDSSRKKDRTAKFDANDVDAFLERYIGILYKKGYNEITVIAHTSAQRQRISKYVSQLVGFEIIDQQKSEIVLRNISKDSPEEFPSILKRIFHTVIAMGEEGIEAVENNNKDQLKSLLTYEELNNKLTDYAKRLIYLFGVDENSVALYAIIKDLEAIADEFRDLFSYCIDNKFDPKSRYLLIKISPYFKLIYDLYSKKELALLPRISKEKSDLSKDLALKMQNAKCKDAVLYHHLSNLVQRIFDMTGATARLAV